MIISASKYSNDGFSLELNGDIFTVKYPTDVWGPYNQKEFLMDNFLYLNALQVPLFLKLGDFKIPHIKLNCPEPLLKPFFILNHINFIPFAADLLGESSTEWIKTYLESMIICRNDVTEMPPLPESNFEEKAIINFSFGKDSLLSFALAREIGLNVDLLRIEESNVPMMNQCLNASGEMLSNKFNVNIHRVKNETGSLSDYNYWKVRQTEWGNGDFITNNTLLSLPFIHNLKCKYLIFGNERSCNDYYINSEGYKSYPVFDQSSSWLRELTKITKLATNNQTTVCSIIEPIHELAIIKILHKRYPEIARYQISCFTDIDLNDGKKWCMNCSKCARTFVFLKANGIDVKNLGFTENLFDKKFRGFYSLFGGENATAYDATGLNRDEQLLAFYMAYQKGEKGDLIDLFKTTFLDEATEREDELHKEYMGVHGSLTCPKKYYYDIASIMKEELN
jgi:hypothetical protein